MKKLFFLSVVLAMVAGLTGCQQSAEPAAQETAEVKAEDGSKASSGTLEFNPNYKEPEKPK